MARPSTKPAPGFTYLRSLRGDEAAAYQIRWSPDGARLAAAFYGGALCVWDAEIGTRLVGVRAHSSRAYCLAWSPDGRRIATGSDDKTVRIWDSDTAAPLAVLEAQESVVWGVDWSADGERIASGSSRGTVFVWDASTGDVLEELEDHEGSVRHVAWAPASGLLASVSDDHTARIWDGFTGELLHTLPGDGNYPSTAVWSPDGCRLAWGGQGWTVFWWDAESGEVHSAEWDTGERIVALTYSADGRILAALSEHTRTLRLYDVDTATVLATVVEAGEHTTAISPVAPVVAVQPKSGEIALWHFDGPTLVDRAPVSGALVVRRSAVTAPAQPEQLAEPVAEPAPMVLPPEPTRFDVFLCHNSADAAAVQSIADGLETAGIRPWIDREQIQVGRSLQSAIQDAFPLIHAAAVFLGPAGFGRWQREEIEVLMSRSVERGLPVIVVLLPGAPELPDSQAFLRSRLWVRFEELADDSALRRLTESVLAARGAGGGP